MKTIIIKSNGVGRYDDVSPFIIADNKLEIKTELPELSGEFFLIAENNGKIHKRFLQRGKSITLEKLDAGELTAEVKHYVKGVLVKTYKIEPLILREVDGNLNGTPEITALRQETSALREILANEKQCAKEREEKLLKAIGELKENMFALVLFAYTDFKFNVFLEGGSREEFLTKFGFKLTEEQINKIFGGKEND